MSSKNNVNPDHYKTAGRQRQGENIIRKIYKREYAQSKTGAGADAINFITGDRRSKTSLKAERQGGESERAEADQAA